MSRLARITPSAPALPDRLSAAFVGTIALGLGCALGLAVVLGSAKVVAAAIGLAFVSMGVLYPRLILYAIVVVLALFSEKLYGVSIAAQTSGVFRVSAYRLDPIGLNLYEILVCCLLAILIARRAVKTLPREVPTWITVPCLVVALVILIQFARALLAGTSYAEALPAAEYVLAAVAMLWCCCELLGEKAKRLQLLDLLFVCATARAAYALFRFAFGSGDTANAYAHVGVKVALWEVADHLLFVFLIVVAVGAWASDRLDARRFPLWAGGSLLMAVTIVLSFRRASWFGLVAGLLVAAVVLLPRYRRAMALVPGLIALVAAILVWSFTRFSSGGSIVERLFPDVVSTGPTRQDEWALAWRTIAENPVFGDLMARRAAGFFAPWPTSVVHNAFLMAWMKLGLAGLLSLMVLGAICAGYAIRVVRARGVEDHIALGTVAILPFTLFLSMFATPIIELRTMFVLAISAALAVRVATANPEPEKVAEVKSPIERPESAHW